MGTLQFDGVDDTLQWDTLASALQNVPTSANTIGVLLKRSNINSPVFQPPCDLEAGGFARRLYVEFNGNANQYITNTGGCFMGFSFTSTADPYMIIASKASGTSTPRVGWKLGSGGSWTHEDGDNTVGDASAAATKLLIGTRENLSGIYIGWIGVVAFWAGAMSDANKEVLDDNWSTSDWWNSAHGQPLFLVELNVAGTSVVDLAGNASALTVTGTTLDATETLNNWNFNGIGVRPMTASAGMTVFRLKRSGLAYG